MNDLKLNLAISMATQALELIKEAQDVKSTNGIDGAAGPAGRDGTNGLDGINGSAGLKGKDGLAGLKGDKGDCGDTPDHEVNGDRVRFTKPDGKWGKWLDVGQGSSGGGGGGTDAMRQAIHTFTAATPQLKDLHSTVLCDATAQAQTVTLMAAKSLVGRVITIKKIDSTTNTVTIDGYGTDLIDGETTQVIVTQWTSLRLQSDGNNWVIM